MVSNIALWNRIACFTPDDPCTEFPFTDRLARENGWSKDFVRHAVEEYKKFVYLAMVAPRQVTPSVTVDRIWHLHLIYTRSYWDELCGSVLRRALHHNPGTGGRAESARYRDQYARTLALYRAEFGVEAPAAYWPHMRARPARQRAAIALGGAAALLTGGVAHGAVQPIAAGFDLEGLVIVAAAVVGVLCLSALAGTFRGGKKKAGEGSSGSTFDFDVGGSRKGKAKGDPDGDGDGGGGDGGSSCGGGGCGD